MTDLDLNDTFDYSREAMSSTSLTNQVYSHSHQDSTTDPSFGLTSPQARSHDLPDDDTSAQDVYQMSSLSLDQTDAVYQPLTMYPQPFFSNPNTFQPYRIPQFRNPGSKSPPHSPSLSASPPRNGFSPSPTGVSPQLVSPMSTFGSSPGTDSNGLPWHDANYQHGNLSNLYNMHGSPSGLSMMQGYPYYSPINPMTGFEVGKVPPPQVHRTRPPPGMRPKAMKREEDEDDIGQEKATGLGFTPSEEDQDDRVPVRNVPEDLRKARIQSEQRRRDELREGFHRLKEVLPTTNQRTSKSSLLDRSVAHIQQIQGANRYLLNEIDKVTQECRLLRETNEKLASVVAVSVRGSPGSGGS